MDTDPPSLPRRRALAFPGGGFDTAMQLGVAHAILVARGVPPDYVVGISAGALNATALAEILQANPSELSQAERRLKSDDELLAYRVDKLRTFLDAWIETPGELLRAIAPDGLEIIAKDPLDPIELPIHFRGERKGRDAANRSRAGLIGLIDRIFHIDIPVATATRLIRRFLGIAEAMELGIGAKSIAMLRNVIGILWTFVTDFASIAPLLGSMAWSALAGPNREILREFQHAIVGRTTAGRVIARFRAARLLLHGLKLLMQALIAVFLLPFTPLAFSARVRRWLAGPVFSRLLAYYDIGRGIGNTDVVRQRIIQCFDPHYFG